MTENSAENINLTSDLTSGQVGKNIKSTLNYNATLSSPGNFTWNNSTKTLTTTGSFCTVIFELNQNAKTIIHYTKTNQHGGYIGLQNVPTITQHNRHGGTESQLSVIRILMEVIIKLVEIPERVRIGFL